MDTMITSLVVLLGNQDGYERDRETGNSMLNPDKTKSLNPKP